MKIIQNGIVISDIGCEGIERIEVSDEDGGVKRAYIHLGTGGLLATFHNDQEIDNLIEALQAARKAMDD